VIAMGLYQGSDLKKISGGRRHRFRKPRKYEVGSYPIETKLYSRDIRHVDRVFGGNIKVRLRYASYANVLDPKTGRYSKARIIAVVETPANREYARRGIIVKGSVIQTEVGKAKVVSRPSQDGIVNAVLIEESSK